MIKVFIVLLLKDMSFNYYLVNILTNDENFGKNYLKIGMNLQKFSNMAWEDTLHVHLLYKYQNLQ